MTATMAMGGIVGVVCTYIHTYLRTLGVALEDEETRIAPVFKMEKNGNLIPDYSHMQSNKEKENVDVTN